jgi:hypothetical protein
MLQISKIRFHRNYVFFHLDVSSRMGLVSATSLQNPFLPPENHPPRLKVSNKASPNVNENQIDGPSNRVDYRPTFAKAW